MEYTKDALQGAVKSHVGEHYTVLGDSGCMDWYPEIDSAGNLTGEIVPADGCPDHVITGDSMAAMIN